MKLDIEVLPRQEVVCSNCAASCCRLEVLLITDTGVPDHLISYDEWGGRTMSRLDDGFCVALDRNTMRCMIYEHRPLICRDFKVASDECVEEREVNQAVVQQKQT